MPIIGRVKGRTTAKMVSEHVFKLCQGTETVSSVLAGNTSETPGEVVKRLYGHHAKDLHRNPDVNRPAPSAEALEMAFKCGRWGPTRPSPLFLQAFADSLDCLDADPMAGIVSPPLMGSHGTVPLTVIAPLADIIRHCANLIVRAEREVFFITCSWSPSVAQRLVKNALIELSRRAGLRGQRVVVKMMYDKAAAANVMDPHQAVKTDAYTSKSIQLPSPEEIPNLDFQVVSLHKMMLGTLHAKFCVVDRKVAAIMSNNMEDNVNVEMMIHVEGPIVDSLYDTALITWNNILNPPLPSHDAPAAEGGLPTHGEEPQYVDRGIGRNQTRLLQRAARTRDSRSTRQKIPTTTTTLLEKSLGCSPATLQDRVRAVCKPQTANSTLRAINQSLPRALRSRTGRR